MTSPTAPPSRTAAGDASTGPSVRQRAIVAVVVGVLIVAGCVGFIAWITAYREAVAGLGSTPASGIHPARTAALVAAGLFGYLTLFQIGLATGRIPGRMAWGGRHETLPPELRRASAMTAALMPLLAWLLLERADVVDVVRLDAVITVATWGVPLLFLLSAAGNLASASPAERRLGIPVTAAQVVLGVAVALGA